MRNSNSPSRRAVLALAATACLPAARAQAAWPDRPLKLIVPFAPGASVDSVARFLGGMLSARLGQPVVVENRAGAGGMVGTAFVAGQPADGYTLLMQATPYVAAPLVTATTRKPPYDPAKDLQPVALVGTGPLMVVVSSELKVNSLRELIELARAKPQSVNYGSAGTGTVNHLGAEMFASVAGVKLTHVPFNGLGPALTALLGGTVQVLVASLPSVLPHVRSGKMRALAVTGTQRSPIVPDVPAAAEAGLAGFELETWWGVLGPVGIPAPVLKRLNEEINAVLATPDLRELLARDGAVPRPGSPDDFAGLIRAEIPRLRKVIQDARIVGE